MKSVQTTTSAVASVKSENSSIELNEAKMELNYENKAVTKMNGSNFEPSQNQVHIQVRIIVSFNDLLSHPTFPVCHIRYVSLTYSK